jgi:hypothetical protein
MLFVTKTTEKFQLFACIVTCNAKEMESFGLSEKTAALTIALRPCGNRPPHCVVGCGSGEFAKRYIGRQKQMGFTPNRSGPMTRPPLTQTVHHSKRKLFACQSLVMQPDNSWIRWLVESGVGGSLGWIFAFPKPPFLP